MNEAQRNWKELVEQRESKVRALAGELSKARKELREAKRQLDKRILADPKAWVEE